MPRISVAFFLLVSFSTIYAQPSKSIKLLRNRTPQAVESGRVGSLSEPILNRIAKAQSLMAAERYQDALEILDKLEKRMQSNPYALSQVYQTKAYIYAQSDRFDDSVRFFKACLKLKSLPKSPTLDTMYSLAQVLAATDQYQEAIPLVQDYIHSKEPKRSAAIFFLGQLWAQIKQEDLAIKYVVQAINLEQKPQESWMRLLVALYYEAKEYKKSVGLLEKLIKLRPNKVEYWKQLVSVWLALRNEGQALVTLELAYKKGLLEKEQELLQLIQVSLLEGVPYKAARYLEKALERGSIKTTQKNYVLLAESWIRAQELERAAEAMGVAAEKSKDGRLFVRQGQILLERENWKGSIRALKKGLAKGGIKKIDEAYISLGIAFHSSGNSKEALKNFRSVKSKKFLRQAQSWIKYIQEEQ